MKEHRKKEQQPSYNPNQKPAQPQQPQIDPNRKNPGHNQPEKKW